MVMALGRHLVVYCRKQDAGLTGVLSIRACISFKKWIRQFHRLTVRIVKMRITEHEGKAETLT